MTRCWRSIKNEWIQRRIICRITKKPVSSLLFDGRRDQRLLCRRWTQLWSLAAHPRLSATYAWYRLVHGSRNNPWWPRTNFCQTGLHMHRACQLMTWKSCWLTILVFYLAWLTSAVYFRNGYNIRLLPDCRHYSSDQRVEVGRTKQMQSHTRTNRFRGPGALRI